MGSSDTSEAEPTTVTVPPDDVVVSTPGLSPDSNIVPHGEQQTRKPSAARRYFASIVAVVLGILLVSGLVILVVTAPSPERTGVEVLTVLLGWPPIALIIVVFLALTFRIQATNLLTSLQERIWSVKAAGLSIEVGRQAASGGAGDGPDVEALLKDKTALEAELETLRARDIPADVQAELADRYEQLERQVWFWHYEYLSAFLKPHSQAILRWLASLPAGALITDAVWNDLILPNNPAERAAVGSAFVSYGLIEKENEIWRASEKARALISHIDQYHPSPFIIPSPDPPYAPRPTNPNPPPSDP